jgi:hypothetical protein
MPLKQNNFSGIADQSSVEQLSYYLRVKVRFFPISGYAFSKILPVKQMGFSAYYRDHKQPVYFLIPETKVSSDAI